MKPTKADILMDLVLLIGIFVCVMVLIADTDATEQAYEPTTLATIEETMEYITEPIQEEKPTEAVTEPAEETEETEEVTEETTEETTEVTEPVISYSEKDLEYLAIVIYQEAGGDNFSDDTRLKVGTVVMNRVADPRFPDDLHGVLTQEQQYGLLHWTGVVWADRAKNPGEEHAVKRAYKFAEQILMGYRSFGEDVVWQAEFPQGSEIVAYQDGMYFCR